jgi:hypothetical protein
MEPPQVLHWRCLVCCHGGVSHHAHQPPACQRVPDCAARRHARFERRPAVLASPPSPAGPASPPSNAQDRPAKPSVAQHDRIANLRDPLRLVAHIAPPPCVPWAWPLLTLSFNCVRAAAPLSLHFSSTAFHRVYIVVGPS